MADEAPASPCERWAEETAAKAPAVDANDISEPEPEARERLRCVFLGRSAGGGSLRRGAGVPKTALAVAVLVLAELPVPVALPVLTASDADCALPCGGTMLICTPCPLCLAALLFRGGGGGAGD